MEIIFEILIQFLIEFVGQIIIELLAEFGLRGLSHATGVTKPKHPILASVGYVILAIFAAAVSVHFYPLHNIKSYELRILNLVVTPVIIGWLMAIRGRDLRAKTKETIRLDSFFYGWLFAMTFALVRFLFAQ